MSKANSAIAGAAAGFSLGGPWGAAAGGLAGFLGGKDDNSQDYYQRMLDAAAGIPLPVLKEQHPELYAELAKFNPEMDQAIRLGDSAMGGISLDPRYKDAQMAALVKLQNITNSDGKDAQFMADAARLQNDVNTNLQGNTGAIQQNLATRGMSGGPSEAIARQIAAQQGANRQSQMGLDLNAQAQQRALSALMNQGQLGSQMSAQDFSQQAQKAQASDAIARFNAQNTQSVNSANVASKNAAQLQNNQNAQNINNQNVDLRNQAQNWNTNGMAQQNFSNQMQRVGMGNSALQNMGQNSARQAQGQDQFIGGVASAVGQYAGQQQALDAWKKKQGVV